MPTVCWEKTQDSDLITRSTRILLTPFASLALAQFFIEGAVPLE